MINALLATITALTAPLIIGGGGIVFVVVMGISFASLSLRQIYGQGVPAEARGGALAAAGAAGDN